MPKPKQTDVVVNLILSRIDSGDLMPGDQIDEKDLIASCEVSRTPVREALIQLEATGLVVRHSRKGVSLFRPDVPQFLAILEVHANLEAHAAELAAKRLTEETAADLRRRTQDCTAFADSAAPESHVEYYRLNMLYHAAIAEASANAYLIEMIKLNARKLMSYYRLRYRLPGAIALSAQEHEVITGHILARDSDAARAAMISHFNYDRDAVMNMIASIG
ncbi:GntR family transcriptional regulator [Pseudooceanicola sp.]|uniref:GntR family transcriptional regulator n=1 Tax=Pseudooceanicola sp. TaxID=1914328 RepID=UPI0035C70584